MITAKKLSLFTIDWIHLENFILFPNPTAQAKKALTLRDMNSTNFSLY